jgi:DNA polymerase-3 subunit gamma/tau
MLDQAIVLGNGRIDTKIVKEMLGLADRLQTFGLYEKLLEGDVAAVLENLQEQYKNGATPMVILQDLIDITHLLAKIKVLPDFINDPSVSENDREMCKKLCAAPINILSKIWQMLIKGLSELQYANVQIDALEMILLRIAYSAGLPTPAELLKELKKKSGLNNSVNIQSSLPKSKTEERIESELVDESERLSISTTADLIDLMTAKKQPLLMFAVKNDMSFKDFSDGHMRVAISENAEKDLILRLRTFLEKETGRAWVIDIDYEPLGETLAFQESQRLNKDKKNISEYPLVKAILSEFNGAKIETIIRKSVAETENDDEAVDFAVSDTINEIDDEE